MFTVEGAGRDAGAPPVEAGAVAGRVVDEEEEEFVEAAGPAVVLGFMEEGISFLGLE